LGVGHGAYNGVVKVSQAGEFALIERLAGVLGGEAPAELLVGIGDDAAVWRSGGEALIATTDTMVEGVHFLPDAAPWADVGWKALAANVSDVAAMGGTPLFALVTLGLPPERSSRAPEALYEGLRECAAAYGVTVAGGDIVRAPQMFVTVALLGWAEMGEDGEPLLLRRDGAREGDVIAVTGALGGSAAGLLRLREGGQADDPLVRRHLRPEPRLAAGQAAVRAGIACGIDVSDGLMQDVGHVCERSGLGAEVEASRLPLSEGLAKAFPDDAVTLAASGGEDYELVLVGTAERIDGLRAALDVPLTVTGRMKAGEPRARLLDDGGAEIALTNTGFDQLRDR
jgi:thiamine-monophosphate kinase